MPVDTYDAIVIGSGHNGLIAASYLARAGWRVAVLERREIIGGACVTEEIFPGFKVSTAAYVCSLLQPRIIKDLKLESFGFELLTRDPSSFSPLPGNRHLLFWKAPEQTYREIAKFSEKDAQRFAAYEKHLEQLSQQLEPLLMRPAPHPQSLGLRGGWQMFKTALRLRNKAESLVRLFSMSAAAYLDRWFESEELKVRLATDGVIGTLAGPYTPGTAYILLHHVMGEANGQRGVWGYVRGGMGTITHAIAQYLLSKKGTIETNAEVDRITVKGEECKGVVLKDGREFRAKVVLSSADPQRTFLGMFDPLDLPESLVADVKRMRFASGSVKINIAARGLPNFIAFPGTSPGPQHRGTIHLCPSMEYIERAYEDAKWGRMSERPVVEMCIPSVVDETVAPPGKQFISLFVQYAPYKLADGQEWSATTEKEFAQRTFSVIREYVSNWDEILEDYQILTPKGLEERFGLTGGNIFHGEMSVDQLGFLRPSAICSHYSTPIKGFYLCGSGSHPGGGVMGAPGYLAAKRVLQQRRR